MDVGHWGPGAVVAGLSDDGVELVFAQDKRLGLGQVPAAAAVGGRGGEAFTGIQDADDVYEEDHIVQWGGIQ